MGRRGCGGGWYCEGGAKPDGLVISVEKSKSNTFINMKISSCLYQCYCLSSHLTIRYYFFLPKKCKSVRTFYIYLAKLLSKVHVSNNRSHTMTLRIFLCTLGWSIKLAKIKLGYRLSYLKSLCVNCRRVSL